MTERNMAGLLRSVSMKLTSLDRRVARIPRPPSAAVLAYVGDVKLTARGAVQTGWLACNGSLQDGDEYPALYTAIGDTYNTGGEPAGSFRVPNLSAASLNPNLLYIIKT